MNRIYLILIILFLSGVTLSAQTPGCTTGTVSVCAGGEVLLPVTGYNIYNAGAITLCFGFDSNQLSYLTLQNIDPQLVGIEAHMTNNPSRLVVTWSDPSGADFPQTKFFDIKFQYNSGNNEVKFNDSCEIADISMHILDVTFTDGSVGEPVIDTQPQNTAIKTGMNAWFRVSSPNSVIFRWEQSIDNGSTWSVLQEGGKFTGTQSSQLMITDVPVTFDNTFYRCSVGAGACATTSVSGKLIVDSLNSVGNIEILGFTYLKNQPNPFTGSTSIEYVLPDDGNVRLTIIDGSGKTVTELINKFQFKGDYRVTYSAPGIPSGIYLCRLEFQSPIKKYFALKKMLKN
jgi:hypothetical protein